jgi:peroxiredoxin
MIAFQATAQESVKPAYLKYPVIPQFTLLSTDSQSITKAILRKKSKTMLMYFSPTCDHCQVQINNMLKQMDKLRDVQILMITNQPFFEMKEFYKDKKLSGYKNITMGQDTKFFFPPYYKMKTLPFMALYNKEGNLVTTFEGTTAIDKIIQAFNRKN